MGLKLVRINTPGQWMRQDMSFSGYERYVQNERECSSKVRNPWAKASGLEKRLAQRKFLTTRLANLR